MNITSNDCPVWEREDVPTFMESGRLDHDYMDALVNAAVAAKSEDIMVMCENRFNEHVRIVLD